MISFNTRVSSFAIATALLLGGSSAFAQSSAPGLSSNETAARNAIVEQASPRSTHALTRTLSATRLADNENAARRVIVDATATRTSARRPVIAGDAVLVHNERAARRAIADLPSDREVDAKRSIASGVTQR